MGGRVVQADRWRKAVDLGWDVAGGDQVLGCGERSVVVGRGKENQRGRERKRANPKIRGLGVCRREASGRAESGQYELGVARATLRIRLGGLAKTVTAGCSAAARLGGFGLRYTKGRMYKKTGEIIRKGRNRTRTYATIQIDSGQ